jgi:hypothetical protein
MLCVKWKRQAEGVTWKTSDGGEDAHLEVGHDAGGADVGQLLELLQQLHVDLLLLARGQGVRHGDDVALVLHVDGHDLSEDFWADLEGAVDVEVTGGAEDGQHVRCAEDQQAAVALASVGDQEVLALGAVRVGLEAAVALGLGMSASFGGMSG